MKELDYLIKIFSRRTLDKLSRDHKTAYKYCLGGIFSNIVTGGNRTEDQEKNFRFAEMVLRAPRKKTDFKKLKDDISVPVERSFENAGFKKPYNAQLFNKIIVFARTRLGELKTDGKSLFLASELKDILDIKELLGKSWAKDYHWIDFNLHIGFTLTVPEAIILHDFKVHWNDYVVVNAKEKDEESKERTPEKHFKFSNSRSTRERLYKLAALARTLIFLNVSFAEAYLYNLFYTIKATDIEGKQEIESVLNYKRIEDEIIVKKVVYKLFPAIKDETKGLFKEYLAIVKLRNRYVHASPFISPGSNVSEIQPLLNVTEDVLLNALQVSFDFVLKIDSMLPDNLKLLLWWYDDKEVKFEELKKMKLVNEDSRYGKIKYRNAG
jgi:hypothetical protein